MIPPLLKILCPIILWCVGIVEAKAETLLEIEPDELRQEFHGMGCGAIFYEAHITSLAATGKNREQTALYDAMFRDVRTDILQLMIRHDHEPENDNSDPQKPSFASKHFAYTDHTIAICKAARKRNPQIRFSASIPARRFPLSPPSTGALPAARNLPPWSWVPPDRPPCGFRQDH